jgi:enediyne biosynthesis protein E5
LEKKNMPQNKPDLRLAALWRFAVSITVLNILGHTVLGFEQPWAYPLVALVTALSLELLLEWIDAWSTHRTPRFVGGLRSFVTFLLPAYITALAVSMLLYANDELWPIVFAAAAAVCSKAIFRVPVGKSTRHIYNPSNFGISLTLLVFPWVSIAPPYHFTENLSALGRWGLPALIVATGFFINWRFTGKLPLIAGWLCGFVVQAILRSLIFGTPIVAALLPMSGLAFVLFTFYMITDPGTTPVRPRAQVVFGLGVAAAYGLLLVVHIVFGLFFALTIVCTVRGLGLYAQALRARRGRVRAAMATSATSATSQVISPQVVGKVDS